jgi:hypothetical protein
MNYISDAKYLASKIDSIGQDALQDPIINAYETDFGKQNLMLLLGYAYHYSTAVEAYSAFYDEFCQLDEEGAAISKIVLDKSKSESIKLSRNIVDDIINGDIDDFTAAIIICNAMDSLESRAQSVLLRSIETHKPPVVELDINNIDKDMMLMYADAFDTDSEALDFVDNKIEQLKSFQGGEVEVYTVVDVFSKENAKQLISKAVRQGTWSLLDPENEGAKLPQGSAIIKGSIDYNGIELEKSIVESSRVGKMDLIKLNDYADKKMKVDYLVMCDQDDNKVMYKSKNQSPSTALTV